ncbi:peptide ABC transporter substrate-binding protein [Sphingomonas nostoxanthinifaciens]|uniref:peptide ABC transporter substrate-binding protein n=1 Tax=Sphingomonas nostoxanthinifaciens TaxID=2872652 RepID=UPI001CC1C9B5|nr:peptide ABC transporter substrate-binding protein [Sphingomonas nostoxanthinifaciens]UAK23781.1 peptide ABC transporter substrate-binding protein [Sphingomonas nostoxanthinifaciens]
MTDASRGQNWSRRGALGGIAAATTLSGCRPLRRRADNTLVAGLTYDLDTLNVYSTGFLGDVQAAVVEGLLAPDAHARYVPVLATSVPSIANGGIVIDPDGTGMTITYALRRGVRWHDGAPFTAADVAFTWRAVRNPAFLAESKDGAEEIVAIETPDPFTVVCRYAKVTPTFAATLFTFGILPKHLLEGVNLNNAPYNERPIGTGPFIVTRFRRGQYVLTERNPHYWRRDAAGRQLPYIDRLIFKIIPNSNTLLTQLRSGELDLVTQTPYDQAKQMNGLAGVDLVRSPLLSWQHLDFNFRNPLLRDPAIRRAIAHALDRSAMVKVNGGFQTPAWSVVVPIFDFHDPHALRYPYDPVRARAILDAAGYVPGPDGVRARAGARLSFRVVTQAGKADDELTQQIILAQLKAIGIEAFADNKMGIAYRQARYKGDFDMTYSSWVTGVDPVYSRFFATHGSNNGQAYSNPAMDRILAQMESTLDPVERKRAAFEMQHLLAVDLPTIPLTNAVAVVSKNSRLQGFTPNPTNMTPYVSCAGWRLNA